MRARALHAADAAKLLHQLCITEVVVVVVVVCVQTVFVRSHTGYVVIMSVVTSERASRIIGRGLSDANELGQMKYWYDINWLHARVCLGCAVAP